jgi:two-component system phosphate regulon sensor histidine kinase PhoR
MDFSGQPLNILLADVDELLHSALMEMGDAAKAKNINLSIKPPHRIEKIFGDKNWLLVMLNNLLDNAIKYTSDGGSVWIETANRGRRIQIDVGDTGMGIAPELIPHIFEKFYRVKGGETPFVQGTGLGLSLVKRIVERHGGDITVRSKQGEGSVFSVFLPIAE